MYNELFRTPDNHVSSRDSMAETPLEMIFCLYYNYLKTGKSFCQKLCNNYLKTGKSFCQKQCNMYLVVFDFQWSRSTEVISMNL